MISKRNRRPGRPQENIRQFALNNSKGVDSTKSPTDFSTISAAKNLIVNPDGSMSLRKPLECIRTVDFRTNPTTVHRLYDGKHTLKASDLGNGSWIFSIHDEKGDIQTIRATCMGYDGNLITKDDTLLSFIVPNETIELLNLNTASILGNCDIRMSYFGDKAVDYTLYDIEDSLPRYVHIYYAEDDGIWTVAVKQPEINTLTTAEGEIALNPNMTLDNPTAVRDTYASIVPTVKGIIAYTASTLENGKVVPTPLPSVSLKRATASALATDVLFTSGSSLEREIFSTESGRWNSSSFGDFEPHLTTKIYSKSSQCIYRLTLTLPALEGVKSYDIRTTIEHYSCNTRVGGEATGVYEKTFVFKNRTESAEDLTVDFEAECTLYGNTPNFQKEVTARIAVQCTAIPESYSESSARVCDITESVKTIRYRILNSLKTDSAQPIVLKAFCNLPKPSTDGSRKYYATWFKSTDGVSWTPLNTFFRKDGITVRVLDPDWSPDPSVENDAPASEDYYSETYFPLEGSSERDDAFKLIVNNYEGENVSGLDADFVYENFRIDAVHTTLLDKPLELAQFRFKIVAVESLGSEDVEWDSSENAPDTQYRVYATIAQQEYTPNFKNDFEFFDVDFGNAVYGKKFYNKKSIYSYGSEKFLNNIFVSDIDSFITPLYNILDLDTHEASRATCIVPWRDYLISATENALYLHSRQSEGFLTKTVNTSIGIPEEDSRCCKAILNGILFKSGPKIYQMYPNMYSGDDSTLNLTEISKPVEDYLEEYAQYLKECLEEGMAETHIPFAFSTDSEYILMLPNSFKVKTTCLRYNYSSKLWTVCIYPIVAHYYEMLNLNDIRIFGNTFDWYAEFKFDSECSGTTYGDVIPFSELETVPIEFEWDTGQKTDNISLAKQFVESKLVFATEDDLEFFPMELTVHVDGDPHVTTLDVNSDAPFWKVEDSKGVANTAFRLGSESDTGVFRQLIVRYSGKGRSVRHILRGSPTSNFRLYETYVRYKTLNIKR